MKKIIFTTFLFSAIHLVTHAQVDLTLYNMQSVFQSSYVNPSNMPAYKTNIGLPGLSSIYTYVSNSGFAYSDLITKRSDDSLILDFDNAINAMAEKNFIGHAAFIDLFSFGIRVKKNYFSLNVTEKENINFTYTKDFFDFLLNGNSGFLGKKADFSGLGLEVNHYREYGLNMAREINEKLTVGGRIKYLYGMENISTTRSNFSLYTDESTYALTLETDLEINTSLLENNPGGYTNIRVSEYLLKQKNNGWGLDLGAHYQFNKRWNFSMSMIDLGFINWKSNVKNYKTTTQVHQFEGVDLGDFVGDTSNSTENVMDSLVDSFKLLETNNSYTTYLSTHVFAGANYSFNEKRNAGLLMRGQFFKGNFMPSATLSLNQQVGRHMTLALSYSALNRSYNNLGFGMSMTAGPVQIYLASDNVLGIIQPLNARTVNAHFGINLVFGRKPKDRDGDKVPDKSDACPEVFGLVALNGCPDKDEDGIADKDDVCPFEAGPVISNGCPDKDSDGIADKADACPDTAGLGIFDGCPDTDADSIPDKKDACPEVAGLQQFNGCPDSDGDNVTDLQDSCPTVAGLEQLHGCPDSDEDGVIDLKDDCPTVRGSVTNNGCPAAEKLEMPKEPVKAQLTKEEQEVIISVFQNLEFETGKSVLRASSYSSLEELSGLMKNKLTFKLLVDGHTDNVGTKESNERLSQGRADAVKNYLSEKGIDASRIIAKGYGDSNPVVSNSTPEGRQKNRRVEFTIME